MSKSSKKGSNGSGSEKPIAKSGHDKVKPNHFSPGKEGISWRQDGANFSEKPEKLTKFIKNQDS